MKILICILLTFGYCYSQPGQPAHILIPINNDNILKGDFQNNYLMSLAVGQDTIHRGEKSENNYFTYMNGKNYHKFEVFNDEFVTVYPFIPNENFIPKNALIQLSFLEKSTMKEMVIYFRLPRDFGSGMFLQLENLNFSEGTFFFDSCKSKRKYRFKSKNKRNYGVGKIDFSDTTYPITELVDMSKLRRHEIKDAELNRLIKSSPCK